MFAHPQSCVCAKSELDVFVVPPTQTSIESSTFVEHRPVASLTDTSPIEFAIPGSDLYLDLAETLLYLKIKVVKEDNTPIDASGRVSVTNNLLHTLFQQVDVSLGSVVVSPSTNTYPYVSHLATLLGAPRSAKETHLTMSMWSKDVAGEMDKPNAARGKFFQDSAVVELCGHLYPDMFRQNLLLLNGVDVRLRFIRQKDSFSLMSEEAALVPKVRMLDASLFVKRVRLAPQVLEAHARALEIGPAKYPISRMETRSFAIPKGSYTASIDNIFQGPLPRRVIVAFTDNDAYNGSYQKNPFHYKNYDINFLCLHLDADQIPAKAFQPQFSKSLYARSYLSLFAGTGQFGGPTAADVTYADFGKGFALWAFNLTPDGSEGALMSGHMNLVRRGALRLEVKFDSPLPQAVCALIFAETDSLLEINRERQVTIDF